MALSIGNQAPHIDRHIYDLQLEQAMQLYQEPLYKAVYYRLRSHDSVEDILQITWMKLYQFLIKSGQLPALLETLYPWLWVVAHHLVIDHQKKQQQSRFLPFREGYWILEPRIRECDHPDTIVIRSEIGKAVFQALSSLPKKQRDVCRLYFFCGLRLSDIAAEMQCNVNTVKSYLYRNSVPILQKVLKERGIEMEDINFWIGQQESALEQYRSGIYNAGD